MGFQAIALISNALAGIIIIALMLNLTTEWATGINSQREYLAGDLALLHDSLYAAPGEVEINYQLFGYPLGFWHDVQNTLHRFAIESYELSIDDSKVTIKAESARSESESYVRDNKVLLTHTSITVPTNVDSNYHLTKNSERVTIASTAEPVAQFSAPRLDTQDLNWKSKSVVLYTNDASLNQIVSGAKVQIIKLGVENVQTRLQDAAITIILDEGDPKAGQLVTIYYTSLKGKKLAADLAGWLVLNEEAFRNTKIVLDIGKAADQEAAKFSKDISLDDLLLYPWL